MATTVDSHSKAVLLYIHGLGLVESWTIFVFVENPRIAAVRQSVARFNIFEKYCWNVRKHHIGIIIFIS